MPLDVTGTKLGAFWLCLPDSYTQCSQSEASSVPNQPLLKGNSEGAMFNHTEFNSLMINLEI